MQARIKSTVLRVEFLTRNLKKTATNIPFYPWDNLKELETHVRRAARQTGAKVTRVYVTKRLISNPLVE